ncbi:MAG: hypothetical protein IV100_28105 [Myxococcales bacterium]|nr:hypothetical protein [Myxococcales bacterium]
MTLFMNDRFRGCVHALALMVALAASPARAEHERDAGADSVAGAFAAITGAIVIPAAVTTLIGGAVSLGSDSDESPSVHLRGWSIANVIVGTIGSIATVVIALNVNEDYAVFMATPIGLVSAADLGLGIAGLVHERAPEKAAWIPIPVMSVDPEGDVTGHLVFSGGF